MPVNPLGALTGAATGFGVTAGAVVGGTVAAVGTAGITGLIAYIVAKIKLDRQRKAYRLVKATEGNLRALQGALEASLAGMNLDVIGGGTVQVPAMEQSATGSGAAVGHSVGFQDALTRVVGFQGLDGKNLYINAFCINVYNDSLNQLIQGNFNGLSGAVLDEFEGILFSVTSYLWERDMLDWDGDTRRFTLKDKQLPQGCAAMLAFGNTMTALMLRLSQIANAPAITSEEKQARQRQVDLVVAALHKAVIDAHAKGGLLNIAGTKIGGATKGVLRKVAGFKTAREVSTEALFESVQAADPRLGEARKPSLFERMAQSMVEEAEVKAHEQLASELVFMADQGSKLSLTTAINATQSDASKGVGPSLPVDVLFRGSVTKGVTMHDMKRQVALKENRTAWQALVNPYDSRFVGVTALPSGSFSDFRAPGDLHRKTKVLSARDRSADYVSPDEAAQGMQLWADITFLRKVVVQLTDAYRDEVINGQGPNSSMAVYFLQMTDQALSQIQALYQELASSELFTQMMNRSLHHYTKTFDQALHTPNTMVQLGMPGETGAATRAADIRGFFGASARQENNLSALVRMRSSTMASDMRRDVAGHIYLQDRVKKMLAAVAAAEHKPVTQASDVELWDITSPRAKAWTVVSSLMAQGDLTQQDPGLVAIAKDTEQWRTANKAMASKEGAAQAIAQQQAQVTEAYRGAITKVDTTLTTINQVLVDLSVYDKAAYSEMVKYIERNLADHPSLFVGEQANGVKGLGVLRHTLVDALDYHHLADTMFILHNQVRQHVVPTMSEKVLKTAVRSAVDKTEMQALQWEDKKHRYLVSMASIAGELDGVRRHFPSMSPKQRIQLVNAKGQEFQASAKEMMARVDELSASITALSVENDNLATELDVIQAQMERERQLFKAQMGEVQKLIGSHKELFAEGGELTELKGALDIDVDAMTASLAEMQRRAEEFRDTALREYANLSKDYGELVASSMAKVGNLGQSAASQVAAIEAREAALRQVSDAERSSLHNEIFEYFDGLATDGTSLSEDSKHQFEVMIRQKIEVAQQAELTFLAGMKTSLATNVAEARAFLEDAEKHVENHKQSLLTHQRLVQLGRDAAESEEALKDTIALQQQQLELARDRVGRLEHRLQAQTNALEAKVNSIMEMLEVKYAQYTQQKHMGLVNAGETVPQPQLGRLGRGTGERKEQRARVSKEAAIQQQLNQVQTALLRLKVDTKGKKLDFVREETRLRAMDALLSAVAMSRVQRHRFASGMTTSSKNLAGLLLPDTAFKKRALVNQLKTHLRYLQDQFDAKELAYREPNSLRVLTQRSVIQLTSSNSSHRITPRKLATMLRDMAVLQYQVLHNGEKPKFSGGWDPDFDWAGFGAQFRRPQEEPMQALAVDVDDKGAVVEGTIADLPEAAVKGTVAESPGPAELRRFRAAEELEDSDELAELKAARAEQLRKHGNGSGTGGYDPSAGR